MKKIYFIATMMLLSVVTMTAQEKYEGTWLSKNSFEKYVNAQLPNVKADFVAPFYLEMIGGEIKCGVYIMVESAQMGTIKMLASMPGTYTKEGNIITTNLDQEKFKLSLVDLDLNDPQAKESMKDPATKKMVMAMIEGQIKQQMSQQAKEMAKMAEAFSSFEIIGVDDQDVLTIKLKDVVVDFTTFEIPD